jgi:hypothetical protein
MHQLQDVDHVARMMNIPKEMFGEQSRTGEWHQMPIKRVSEH